VRQNDAESEEEERREGFGVDGGFNDFLEFVRGET